MNLEMLMQEVLNIYSSVKLSILGDICCGLYYLHNCTPNPVIHRDLTAKNVLLNAGLTAKITDFGNSRFVDSERMTPRPGTPIYLPENMGSDYTSSIDVYSFGCLALFLLFQVIHYNYVSIANASGIFLIPHATLQLWCTNIYSLICTKFSKIN